MWFFVELAHSCFARALVFTMWIELVDTDFYFATLRYLYSSLNGGIHLTVCMNIFPSLSLFHFLTLGIINTLILFSWKMKFCVKFFAPPYNFKSSKKKHYTLLYFFPSSFAFLLPFCAATRKNKHKPYTRVCVCVCAHYFPINMCKWLSFSITNLYFVVLFFLSVPCPMWKQKAK